MQNFFLHVSYLCSTSSQHCHVVRHSLPIPLIISVLLSHTKWFYHCQELAKPWSAQTMWGSCPTLLLFLCSCASSAFLLRSSCKGGKILQDRENETGKWRKTISLMMFQCCSQAWQGKWHPEWFGMARSWASGVGRSLNEKQLVECWEKGTILTKQGKWNKLLFSPHKAYKYV